MAKIVNTVTSADAKLNREEISDIISNISPQDTPILTLIKSGSAKSSHPEWARDAFEAPSDNAHEEGSEFANKALTPAEKLGNYTQIYAEALSISRSQESTTAVGGNLHMAEQIAKKGVKMRKDVELSIVSNTASASGATRRSGGLPTWANENTSRGANGSDGGFAAATGRTTVATAGTKRPFTRALLDDVLMQAYNSGADPTTIVCSPYIKKSFADFIGGAGTIGLEQSTKGRNVTLSATVDMYQSSYGLVKLLPNRVMAADADVASNVYVVDPSTLAFLWLDKIKVVDRAVTGDATPKALVGEGTLCVKNPSGIGVIADVFGMSSAA